MTRAWLTIAMIVWVGAGAAQAGGPSAAAEKEVMRPGVVVTELLEVKATIEAIDHRKHTLTLRGAQGRPIALKADRAVRNFDQLKKGDVVLADFAESVAIFIRKAGASPSAAEARLVSVAPKGARPAVFLAETLPLRAVVEAVDAKGRRVTLKEPDGSRQVVAVDRSFTRLDEFRKGDDVVLRLTEPIAVKVEKRK